MLLNEWLTEDFIAAIPYISENESENAQLLYYYILATYGEKTTSPIVDVVTDKTIIEKIIDKQFKSKWALLKNAFSQDINLTAKDTDRTEQIDNSIYGYNSDEGVKDYTNKKTIHESVTWDDVYKKIEDAFDFHVNLNYYKIIASDIAKMLTIGIYD